MLFKRIGTIWLNYAAGQFIVIIFVTAVTWGAGILTGIRFPLLNALAAGICENIPNIGPVISGILSAILSLVFGSSKIDIPNWQFAIVTILCSVLIQILQNLVISPLIIGKKMDLHPLAVFFGMMVFSVLFGFLGMILAVPIIASLREIIRYSRSRDEHSG